MVQIGNIYLPVEILSKIFKKLSQKDKIKLRGVCTKFKELIDNAYIFNEGFKFFIKSDYGREIAGIEKDLIFDHHAPLKVISAFNIKTMKFGHLINQYKSEELEMSYPEAVKNLSFLGFTRSMNFWIILNQLTRLDELHISGLTLQNLRRIHLSDLNFNYLTVLEIITRENFVQGSSYRESLDKIQILLDENAFPRLKKLQINLHFEPRQDQRITPKEDFQLREEILFPFLKKCQNTIQALTIWSSTFDSYKILNYTPVEEDENENYKIFCPNLRSFGFVHQNNSKIGPWITFLNTNFEKLSKLHWTDKTLSQDDHEAFYNLIKSQKWVKLEEIVWNTCDSTYFSEVDLIFLKNYQFLKILTIRNCKETGVKMTFKNLKTIPYFCPDLEQLTLGYCRMDSKIVDYLLTGNHLPKLKIVNFISQWSVGIGMRVETFRKIVEEKKIKSLFLMDCIDNETFANPNNHEFIISQIGQTNMEFILYSIQNWDEIEFNWITRESRDVMHCNGEVGTISDNLMN